MSDFEGEISTEAIAGLRQEHIGRLFLRAQRAFSERAYEKLQAYGHEGLSLSHTALLAHLDLEGTHIRILAERAGISKQAMGQLVADLEERGYIARAADPDDRRAIQVKFTPRGWQFLQDAYRVKTEIEQEYRLILGAEGMEQLKAALNLLLKG